VATPSQSKSIIQLFLHPSGNAQRFFRCCRVRAIIWSPASIMVLGPVVWGLPSLLKIRNSLVSGGSARSLMALPIVLAWSGILTSTISNPLSLMVSRWDEGWVGTSSSIVQVITLVLLMVTSMPSFLNKASFLGFLMRAIVRGTLNLYLAT